MFADVLLRYRIRSTAVSALGVCRRRRGAVQPATGGSKLLRREALQTGPGTANRRRPAARLAVRYVTTRLLLMSHVAEQPNGATGARRVRTEVVSKGVREVRIDRADRGPPKGGGRSAYHTHLHPTSKQPTYNYGHELVRHGWAGGFATQTIPRRRRHGSPRALPMRRRRRNLRRAVSPRLSFARNGYSGYLVDPHRSPDDTGSPQY